MSALKPPMVVVRLTPNMSISAVDTVVRNVTESLNVGFFIGMDASYNFFIVKNIFWKVTRELSILFKLPHNFEKWVIDPMKEFHYSSNIQNQRL